MSFLIADRPSVVFLFYVKKNLRKIECICSQTRDWPIVLNIKEKASDYVVWKTKSAAIVDTYSYSWRLLLKPYYWYYHRLWHMPFPSSIYWLSSCIYGMLCSHWTSWLYSSLTKTFRIRYTHTYIHIHTNLRLKRKVFRREYKASIYTVLDFCV